MEINQFLKKHQEEIILFIVVILISLFSFSLGFITAKLEERKPIKIERFQIPNFKSGSPDGRFSILFLKPKVFYLV